MGLMSEGCEDLMRKRLASIMPFQLASLKEQPEVVRSAAGLTLGQMAEYLQPEVSRYTEQALLCCMESSDATLLLMATYRSQNNANKLLQNEHVCEKLAYAIDTLVCGATEDKLNAILPRIQELLIRTLGETTGYKAKESSITALGSLALTACESYGPHAETVLNIMKNELCAEFANVTPLHCRAIECLGCLATGLDSDAFAPHKDAILAVVLKLLLKFGTGDDVGSAAMAGNSDAIGLAEQVVSSGAINPLERIVIPDRGSVYELRASCYRFISCMVLTYKDDMLPMLPIAAPFVLASILCADALESADGDGQDQAKGFAGEDDSAESQLMVRQGASDEQQAACECLKTILRCIPLTKIGKIAEQSIKVLEEIKDFFLSGVREYAAPILQTLLLAQHRAHPPPWWDPKTEIYDKEGTVISMPVRPWKAGYPTTLCKLSEETRHLWFGQLWEMVHVCLESDGVHDSLSAMMEVFSELLEILGPDLLTHKNSSELNTGMVQVISNTALKILTNKHACQMFEDVGDLDDEELSRFREERLFESMSCLVSACAQVLGPESAPQFFSQFHPHMLKLANHSKSETYRAIGLGCYGELMKTLSAMEGSNSTVGTSGTSNVSRAIDLYVTAILPAVSKGIEKSESESLRRNSLFCLGVTVQAAPSHPDLLSKIRKLYLLVCDIARQDPDSEDTEMFSDQKCTIDNAASCLARMICNLPSSVAFPGSSVVPLDEAILKLLQTLPLREDLLETASIARALIDVYFKLMPQDWVRSVAGIYLTACIQMLSSKEQKTVLTQSLSNNNQSNLATELRAAALGVLTLLAADAQIPVVSGQLLPQSVSLHPILVELATTFREDTKCIECLKSFFS